MIHEVLSNIIKDLNIYLKLRFDLNEDKVELSAIVNQDGSQANTSKENIILCTLIGLTEEKVTRHRRNYQTTKEGHSTRVNPPINLNVYAMFSASFKNEVYNDAIMYLSAVIEYFQSHNVFDHEIMPSLPSRVEKLSFEIVNLDLRELSNLWGALGAKYLPSMIYRIRSVAMEDTMIKEEVPLILSEDTDYETQ